jgi:hypothetical protein
MKVKRGVVAFPVLRHWVPMDAVLPPILSFILTGPSCCLLVFRPLHRFNQVVPSRHTFIRLPIMIVIGNAGLVRSVSSQSIDRDAEQGLVPATAPLHPRIYPCTNWLRFTLSLIASLTLPMTCMSARCVWSAIREWSCMTLRQMFQKGSSCN